MNDKKNKQAGLIKTIILIIIGIAILSYFGVDIKTFFTSPQFKSNLGYIWNFITDTWTNYLAVPAAKVWGIWVQNIWTPIINTLNK